jgi:DNA-binding transcriptional regulator of glucitol operon
VRRFAFALRPGWVVFHACTIAAVVTMVLLGRWQLHVSEAKHFSVQNFGYSIQWWAFAAFSLFFWWRIVRDAARRRHEGDPTPAEAAPAQDEPVAYRRYVMPTSAPTDDPQIAAYNAYLARLAAEEDTK